MDINSIASTIQSLAHTVLSALGVDDSVDIVREKAEDARAAAALLIATAGVFEEFAQDLEDNGVVDDPVGHKDRAVALSAKWDSLKAEILEVKNPDADPED